MSQSLPAIPTDDALTKSSTDAAESFCDAFYAALANKRAEIPDYYCPANLLPTGKQIPDITWNGHVLDTALDMQSLFQNSMPTSLFFDIQCIDTQIINPRYYVPKDGEPSAGDLGIRPEKNISILVLVAGGLRMENERKGPLSEFSETFLLVPNLEKRGGKVTDKKSRREWLVESQVNRFVVVYGEGESEGLVSMDVE